MTHAVTPNEWLPSDLFDDLAMFEELLKSRCDVRLADGSSIHGVVAHLLDLVSGFKRETASNTIDQRIGARFAVGLADIAKKTVAVANHQDFAQLCGHFALFLEKSALVQNVGTLFDDPANKLFELLVCLSGMQFGSEVQIDHPKRSAGNNPDVLLNYGGKRWGLGCKVGNSPTLSLPSYMANVKKAVQQIEDSDADDGFVVVSFKNHLDYNALWPATQHPDGDFIYGGWPDEHTASAALEWQVATMLADWENAISGQAGVDEIFNGKKATPLILNYASATTIVTRHGRPTLTNLRLIVPLEVGATSPSASHFVQELDRGLQHP